MEGKFDNLKVGSMVLIDKKEKGEKLAFVKKITNARIYVGGKTYNKINGYEITEGWPDSYLSIPTQEDIDRVNANTKKMLLAKKIRNMMWEWCSLETLEKVLEIASIPTVRTTNTDWGMQYFYCGYGYNFALYVYNDDVKTMYLSNVFVFYFERKQGIGNKILLIAETEARKHNADTICLQVLKSSWMHDWYKRHGYFDFREDEEDNEYIWMKHHIPKC